jgi:hypothetical protein
MAEAEWNTAIQGLREMFPNHPPVLIDRVLRQNRGVVESAISALLRIPPPKAPASSSRKPPPHQSSHKPGAAPPAAPAPAHPPQPEHIFPADFMRWPSDVEWVRVRTDAGGISPLQTEDDIAQGTSGADVRDLLTTVPDQALARRSPGAEAAESGWSQLKSRFTRSGPVYAPL